MPGPSPIAVPGGRNRRAGREAARVDDALGDAHLVDPDPDADQQADREEGEEEPEDPTSVHVCHLLVMKVDGHSLARGREANVKREWRSGGRAGRTTRCRPC